MTKQELWYDWNYKGLAISKKVFSLNDHPDWHKPDNVATSYTGGALSKQVQVSLAHVSLLW